MTTTQRSSESHEPDQTEPLAEIDDVPERAMVVFAHPDDAEIGTGSTIAKWVANGCHVVFVACTTGSSGSNDPDMDSDRIVKIRRQEQEAAAAVLGVGEVVFLDHPDGGLEDDRTFRGELVRAIRKHKPHTVFCHDPHRIRGFQHRDHRMVGIVTGDAIYPFARDHLHFPEHIKEEGLEPHKVRRLLMWGADEPDVIVNTSGGFVETQIEALGKHSSQVGGLSVAQEGESFGDRLRERAQRAACDHDFEYGQTFRQLNARA
ncbi:MAG: PIG-L deacetylase family protein [Chloroflexota bacterium]